MKKLFVLMMVCASFLTAEEENNIVINNAILARVNGKVITVLDLVKKMDVLMMRFHPDQFASPCARAIFYKRQWKPTLVELIDRELVLKAAATANMPVSAGDVRQELEEMFGPNIMFNIERAGLTYSEAYDMIKNDIIIRRMLLWNVSSRVQIEIGPEEIKERYEAYVADSTSRSNYTYRMCTFRGGQIEKALEIAKVAQELINQKKIATFVDLEKELHNNLQEHNVTLAVSDPITQNIQEMAEPIYATLHSMKLLEASVPQVQKGRAAVDPFVRFYVLEKQQIEEPKPFEEIGSQLKNGLMDERYAALSDHYFSKLRKDFQVDIDSVFHALPQDFQPFGA